MFFGLYSKLIAAAMVAMFVAGVGWRGYTAGKAAVRVEWAADVAQRTADALVASEKARARESELQTKVGRVDRAYQDQKRATATVAAAAGVGLQQLEAILAAPAVASSGASATGRTDGTGGLERELLGNCAQALTELGKTADRLEAKVVGLQEFVRAITPGATIEK